MVTNESVEAQPGIAGVRWYEVRRVNGVYSVHQQGTYSPDSVHRWMGSRWGDYTSLNVDPKDDCTFWYVNEYYTLEGQLWSTAGWQTRRQLQAAGLRAQLEVI